MCDTQTSCGSDPGAGCDGPVTLPRRSCYTFIMRTAIAFAAFSILSMITCAFSADAPAGAATKAADPASRPSRPFTLSAATTVVMGPVREDGTIDYVAAINQRFSAGVTAENNAAIPILQVIGPGSDPKKSATLAERRAALGMPPLDEKGDRFISFEVYLTRQGLDPSEHEEMLDKALEGPWKPADLPVVARWLASVDKSLDIVSTASARPRFYVPTGPSGPLIGMLIPDLNEYRTVASALRARAWQRLATGAMDGFSADVLALQRLGRLIGQGPSLVQRLVGIGCLAMGHDTVSKAACGTLLTGPQAEGLLAQQRSLPVGPIVAGAVDGCERYMLLDALGMFAIYGSDTGKLFSASNGPPPPKLAARPWVRDWDTGMRVANGRYDRIVAAMALPTYAQRNKALDKVSAEVEAIRDRAGGVLGYFIPIEDRLTSVLMSSFTKAMAIDTRQQTEGRMTEVALALRSYKTREGKFPAKLEQLCPRYFASEPVDLFAESPFHYALQGDGYLLYSVGANSIDDGGMMEKRRDDIALRAER